MLLREEEAVDAEEYGSDPPKVKEARLGDGTGIVTDGLIVVDETDDEVDEEADDVVSMSSNELDETDSTASTCVVVVVCCWSQGCIRICSSLGRSTGQYSRRLRIRSWHWRETCW